MHKCLHGSQLLLIALLGWTAMAQTPKPDTQKPDQAVRSSVKSQDPANYIEVVEEIGNKRILHYYPAAAHDYLRSREFKVDLGSILLVRVLPDRLSTQAAISNLLITAQLKHGSTTTNVEVEGYSQVGQSQTSAQSQTAVNSYSITNVVTQMNNLFYVAQLILQQTMPDCLNKIQGSSAPLFDPDVVQACGQGTGKVPNQVSSDAIASVFEKYQSEITTFANFFTDPQNAFLQTYFANRFFGMDLDSVRSVAKQFQTALQTKTTPPAGGGQPAKPDYSSLLDRTVLAYEDIWTEVVKSRVGTQLVPGQTQPAGTQPSLKGKSPDEIQNLVESYFQGLPKQLFQELQAYLVDGQINLPNYKGQPGDVLTITVEAKPAATPNNNNPTGAVVQFQISLDGFGMNVGPSSSLFFLKRIGVAPINSTTPPTTAPQPVNFAPSPGASFGFTYRYRNYGKCDEPPHHPDAPPAEQVCESNASLKLANTDKFPDWHPNYMRKENGFFGQFLRGLAPGLAMNVSFMNWNSPTDFDVTTGKFTSSAAASIQVGAGFVASLFDNQVQFTYGWNLQVSQNRQYWGIGLGFVEIGKTLAGYAKAKASSGSQ